MNPNSDIELRVLVLAPIGRDTELSLQVLAKSGIQGHFCKDLKELTLQLQAGAGAALIAEEAFTPSTIHSLSTLLETQPSWSDFPFVIVTTSGQSEHISRDRYALLKSLGNLALLERPIHPATLTAAMETALRARRRQYAARDSLVDLKTAHYRIEELNRDLEKKVAERGRELADSQQALHQAQKLEAIGQLAGGVAHDFNNLLTGILGVAEEIQQSFEASDPRYHDLDSVTKACYRAFAMTRQLLAFGRRQVVQPKVLDLNAIVRDVGKLLDRVIGEHIELSEDLHAVRHIKADAGHLEQVLMNLAVNARDAMPKGGRLVIQTADKTLDNSTKSEIDLPEGHYVLLQVQDTGTGMSSDILKHIFEPFFTTKGKDQGTGLGLATVYGIVKQSEGEVAVVSELGKGTTFKIYFPAVNAEADTLPAATQLSNLGGKELILVVEDEDIVRHVICKKLRKQGYTVIEAGNGQEALDMNGRMDGSIDLIVTDVVMPVLNGYELIQKIHEKTPQVAVLFMSGYPADVMSFRGVIQDGIDFIEKSQLSTDLLPRIRQILNRRLPPASRSFDSKHRTTASTEK